MSISTRTRSKLKQREEESISLLLNLPEGVHDEIFLKLPANSILVSRCVCKLFYNLLSKPNFIKNHINRTKINNKNPKLLCFQYFKASPPVICSVPIDYASISSLSVASSYSFEFNNTRSHQFLGSCDGLVCLKINPIGMCRSIDCYYSILNPLTGEFKEFTDPFYCKRRTHTYNIFYGFGFDNSIDDYKLVVISDFEKARCFKIDVYAVKSDSWSRVQGIINYSFPGGSKGSRGVFLSGSLHWLGNITTQETSSVLSEKQTKTSSEVIVSFHVINEKMVDMPLPDNIIPPIDSWEEAYKILGLWGDCICIAYIWDSVGIDVWVMQEYGVKESWSKRFTTNSLAYPFWKPLWCFENGETVIDIGGSELLLYDPGTERVSVVMVHDISMDANRESYVESIVSLNSGTYLEKRNTDRILKDLELPTQMNRYCRRITKTSL